MAEQTDHTSQTNQTDQANQADTTNQTGQTGRRFKLPSIDFKKIHPISYAFAVLCAVIGICMGLAFGWPIAPWLLMGITAGLLPMALPQQWPQLQSAQLTEQVSLVLLILITLGVSFRALVPVLTDDTVDVEAAIPLLFSTPPLYLIYIILNNHSSTQKADSVTSYLATVFTGPPMVLSLAMGVTITTYTLLLIHYTAFHVASFSWFADKFLERGIIPPLTLMLFFWGVLLFLNKAWMLRGEQRRLRNEMSTSLMSAYEVARKDNDTQDQALEHLLATLWKKSQDSYNVPRYINWAIPILGFIGTVLGISLAADGIQNIISNQSSLSQFSSELGQAISPLGIAFDTTLIALSLSVFLMWIQTMLQRWEDNFLVEFENQIRHTNA